MLVAVRATRSDVDGSAAGLERAIRRRGPRAVGGEIVHGGHQLDAFHAVDDAVVQLERYRERSLRHAGNGIQPLDHRHLPRRAAQIELASVDARDLDAQLAPVARLRQRDVTDVVLEVEVWIVDPVRHVQAAGQLGQPPPEGRRKVQSRVDLLEDALEGDLAAGRRRLVVDEQHLDLHRGFGPFGAQHHVVGPAQLLHVALRSPRPELQSTRSARGAQRFAETPITAPDDGPRKVLRHGRFAVIDVPAGRTLRRCSDCQLRRRPARCVPTPGGWPRPSQATT